MWAKPDQSFYLVPFCALFNNAVTEFKSYFVEWWVRLVREAVVVCSRYNPEICLSGLRKPRWTSVGRWGAPSETRDKHLPNTNLEGNLYANPLVNVIILRSIWFIFQVLMKIRHSACDEIMWDVFCVRHQAAVQKVKLNLSLFLIN
jgi:hypothetical protein